jgi:hypothetical protein
VTAGRQQSRGRGRLDLVGVLELVVVDGAEPVREQPVACLVAYLCDGAISC